MRFRELLKKHPESDPDRLINHRATVGHLKQDPKALFGIYRYRPKDKNSSAGSLGTFGQFNRDTALAGFIRADGPMPTGKPMSLPGVKGARPDYPKPVELDSELARQLSTIMVMDQLLGQWDRFWRNLEATGDREGHLRLSSRDNGGATLSDWEGEWHSSYKRWVTRYDPALIESLRKLNGFLTGTSRRFGSFDDIEAWKDAAGFLTDESFAMFKRKLGLLVDEQLPALEKRHGSRVYFDKDKSWFARATEASLFSGARPGMASKSFRGRAPAAAPNSGEQRAGRKAKARTSVRDDQRDDARTPE